MPKTNKEFALLARDQLKTSIDFKRTRMAQIEKYEDLYNNDTKKQLKSSFNVPVPVLSGMVDTLASAINDPPQIRFIEQEPSDYLAAKRFSALWETERNSQRSNIKIDQKDRWCKKLAIFSGRAILKYWAEGKPYKSSLEVIDYRDFHCEPQGGGHLENHLFCGQEGIWRTLAELEAGAEKGIYSKEQVNKLKQVGTSSKYKEFVSRERAGKFNRFRSLGLNAESFNFIGDIVFPLVEWCLTYNGDRYYILFDDFSGEWLRVEKLKDVVGSDMYPFISWATHEDPKVFWSRGFCDDFYPIADSINVLFNQELTNRHKSNNIARAYDMDLFKDPARLQQMNQRPDIFIPTKLKEAGLQQIQQGIFEFRTPALNGTLDLISFMDNFWGKQTGVNDALAGGAQPASKRVNVFFGEIQSLARRLDYRSAAYREAYNELGLRYIVGVKENIGRGTAIQMLGEEGFDWQWIKKADLSTQKDLDIQVINPTQAEREVKFSVERKTSAINLLANSPNINSRWRDEFILRDIGGLDDLDVAVAMDVMNYGNKELMAEASAAIQILLKGQEPETNFQANSAYVKRIWNFANNNRSQLKEKYFLFTRFLEKHFQIAEENERRKAREQRAGRFTLEEESGQTEPLQPLTREEPQEIPVGSQQPLTEAIPQQTKQIPQMGQMSEAFV